MDADTLAALRASIAKWRANVIAGRPQAARIQASDCPLCKIYLRGDLRPPGYCTECPVRQRTGHDGCEQTPWMEARRALTDWINLNCDYAREDWRRAAQREVDFLISLLPPGVSPEGDTETPEEPLCD